MVRTTLPEKDRPTETKQDELYDLVLSVAKMLHKHLVNILEAVKGESHDRD